MSEYINNKYIDANGVKYLWNKADNKFVSKVEGKDLSDNNYSNEDVVKLAGIEENANNYELPNAAADTLGGIKIGAGLSINEEGVVSTVYNPEMPVDWQDIQETPTTLDGYGITDAASDEELAALASSISDDIDEISASMSDGFDEIESKLNAAKAELQGKIDDVEDKVSKVYKYKGKVATAADLENIENPQNGDVYDVEEDGTNYAWNADEERWDNIGSIIRIDSLSNYELDVITGSASTPAALKELLVKGGNISMSENITLDMAVDITEDTILDLGGHTLNAANEAGYALVADGAKLTIKNGTIATNKRVASAENGGEVVIKSGTFTSGDVAFSASGAGAKVVLDGGNITAQEGGIGSFDGAAIEINGGSITGIDNFPVFTNGTSGRGNNTITINGGEFEGNITSNGYESCCLYVANNDTVVINGGTFISNDGCGILMRAGNVTINDAEIITKKKASGSHAPGWVGDNKTKMSASAVIYHETANYPGKAGMSLVINGGTFTGADLALEVLSAEATPNVTVNGGEFTPAI